MTELFAFWDVIASGLIGVSIGFLGGMYYSMTRLEDNIDGMVDFDPNEFEEGLEALEEAMNDE